MRNDLIEARRALGLTQAQLAAAVGKDQAAISRYENGDSEPNKHVAAKLAGVLEVPVLQVIFGPSTTGAA